MSNHLNPQPTLEEIVSLAKRRGFVYQTSEIYGGLANSYDYGPMGAELMRNIRNIWWEEFISKRTDMVGLDSQILLHPKTWVASGHVSSFTDPLVEDKKTHKRYRADHLIEAWKDEREKQAVEIQYRLEKDKKEGKRQEYTKEEKKAQEQIQKDLLIIIEDMSTQEMADFIKEHNIKSPEGNDITDPKDFNILFETSIGAVTGEKSVAYLRGETAQGIFTNFKQVLDSTRVKLPFGIGQIGRSFRNEITTGQFNFRTLEFEQAEIEYFFDPEETNWEELFKKWQDQMWQFVTNTLGIKEENIRWRRHTDKERSHYSKDTYDLDYKYPFGWKELWGIAYRTDYDLKQHIKHSGQTLEYMDPHTGKKFVPHVIEPAVGVNRIFLMILVDAYFRDEEKNRTVLKLDPKLAPYKAAVFPLLKNKPELVATAKKVFDILSQKMATNWDDRGNIGKRYLYQDEIGTPACITVDFQTLEDQTVTVRNRDTAEQERVHVEKLEDYLKNMIE